MASHIRPRSGSGAPAVAAMLWVCCLALCGAALAAELPQVATPPCDATPDVETLIRQTVRFAPFHPLYMVGKKTPGGGQVPIPSAEELHRRLYPMPEGETEADLRLIRRVFLGEWIPKDAAKRLLYLRDWPSPRQVSGLLVYDLPEKDVSVYLRHRGSNVLAAFKPRQVKKAPDVPTKAELAKRTLELLNRFLVPEMRPKGTRDLVSEKRFQAVPGAGVHCLWGQYLPLGTLSIDNMDAVLMSYWTDGTYLRVSCTWLGPPPLEDGRSYIIIQGK